MSEKNSELFEGDVQCNGDGPTLVLFSASFVAVISSYPLDLMKNRVASASLYKSPLDCMRITWKNEGFKGRDL